MKWLKEKIKRSKKQKVYEYNVKNARKRMIETGRWKPKYAESMAEMIMKTLPPQLLHRWEKWVTTGEETDFEFKGLTLFDMMELEGYPYCDALVRMSGFMERPEDIKNLLQHYTELRAKK